MTLEAWVPFSILIVFGFIIAVLLSTAFVFWCVFNGFFNRLMDRIEIVSGLDRPFKLVRTEKK